MKTIERKLLPGQWKVDLDEGRPTMGHTITDVGLKGLRPDRTYWILRVDAKTFSEMHRLDEHGLPKEVPTILRGTPQYYLFREGQLYLWPAAMYEWTLIVQMEKRRAHPGADLPASQTPPTQR